MAGRNLTGMEAYASTMTNRGGPERKRLKPGDKMADGRIWTGSYKTAVLLQKKEKLESQIAALQAELQEVQKKLDGLMPAEEPELNLEPEPEVDTAGQPSEVAVDAEKDTGAGEPAAPVEPQEPAVLAEGKRKKKNGTGQDQ